MSRVPLSRRRALMVATALLAPALALALPTARAAEATAGAAGHANLSSHAAAATDSGPVTVTQTDPTKFAWLPKTKGTKGHPGTPGQLSTVAPSVTVSQTSALTYQTVQVSWQHFTPSVNTGGLGGSVIGDNTYYDVGVFECKGTPLYGPIGNPVTGVPDCYPTLAAAASTGKDGLGNAVQVFTGSNGTGATQITVETGEENDLLGCSVTTPCSIAVVPNWGGAQLGEKTKLADPCADHTHDLAATNGDAANRYIGQPCSWADRIVVPLSFAPTAATCGTTSAFASEGSPMLQQAMVRWRPTFCHGVGAVSFGFDSGVTESQARSDFTAPPTAFSESTDAAFTTRPASAYQSSQRAFTYAPVANTGIVIAFVIDDPTTGKQLTHLVLDARLVAKMLTESYSLRYNAPVCVPGSPTPTQVGCGDYDNTTETYSGHQAPCTAALPQSASCDPNVAGNTATIVSDPEFRLLNPSLFPTDGSPAGLSSAQVNLGQFLPIVAGGDTDVTYALTSWIEADPEAHAFLAGARDPWGMHVNNAYKDIDWPSDHIDQLDPGWTDPKPNDPPYSLGGWGTMQVALNPVNGLDSVDTSLLTSRPTGVNTSQPVSSPCDQTLGGSNGLCTYGRFGSIATGQRVLFAVLDAGDAANYGFPAATLVNPAGVTVSPTTASLGAGLHDVTVNQDGITTSPDFTAMVGDPAAYPMTVTDYAMTPTCGVSAGKAGALVDFLRHASSATAQTSGQQIGQLTPGYTPLTASQRAQTATAIRLTAGQHTCLPDTPTAAAAAPPVATNPAPATAARAPVVSAAGPVSKAPTPETTVSQNKTVANTAYGVKAPGGLGAVRWLVLLSGLGLLLLLAGGPGLWWVTSTTSGAAAWARLRRVTGR